MKLSVKQYTAAVDKLKAEDPIEYSESYFRSWNHETVRKPFVFKTWDYLKFLYPTYLQKVDDKRLRLFDVPGDPNHYSMLNYLASNHTAFSIIVNYFNNKIIESAKKGKLISSRQLQFDKDGKNWVKEMAVFLTFYQRYFDEVLRPKPNGVFEHLIKVLEITNKRGYLSEAEMLKFLKNVFPLAKNFKTGGHGQTSDIEGGVDIQFDLRDETKTLQQKRCSYIYKGKRNYYVNGVGGIKLYKTSFYGFQTADNKLYIFDNDNSIMIKDYNGNKKYIIPHRLKRYDTKI